MCLCYGAGASNSEIKEALKGPDSQFEMWNSTSIAHIIISGHGFKGFNTRRNAITLLNRYLSWRSTQPDEPSNEQQTGDKKDNNFTTFTIKSSMLSNQQLTDTITKITAMSFKDILKNRFRYMLCLNF